MSIIPPGGIFLADNFPEPGWLSKATDSRKTPATRRGWHETPAARKSISQHQRLTLSVGRYRRPHLHTTVPFHTTAGAGANR
jgi:hypothetical protein